MPGENRRGCIVCNVTVRLPALLCTDCGAETYVTHNHDVLVFLREDGPVEVTEALLDEMVDDLSYGGFNGGAILGWLKGALNPPAAPTYEAIVD